MVYVKTNNYIRKIDELGRIVIPKEVRQMFDIQPGDSLVVLSDKEKGIALIKAEAIESFTSQILNKGSDK